LGAEAGALAGGGVEVFAVTPPEPDVTGATVVAAGGLEANCAMALEAAEEGPAGTEVVAAFTSPAGA
jgi:hypothetical protein